MKNKNNPLTNSRTPELIATYEELYRIPESERVTCYIGDYGGHFFRYGAAEDTILAAYSKALSAVQLSSDDFLRADDYTYRDGMIARMLDCMLGGDALLRDVPVQWGDRSFVSVVHESGAALVIPLEDLGQLTSTGQEDYAALLNATVDGISCGPHGVEIVISGVEVQEMERFCEGFAAHQEAEQAREKKIAHGHKPDDHAPKLS